MGLLNKWLGDFEENPIEQSGEKSSDDVIIAACALLLEIAHSDDEFDDSERDGILHLLKEEYGLTDEDAESITEEAETQRQKSHDLWHFTNKINKRFSREEKLRVVELFWKIVFIDGKLDKHEDHLMHILGNMLNFDHSDLIQAKLNVLYPDEE